MQKKRSRKDKYDLSMFINKRHVDVSFNLLWLSMIKMKFEYKLIKKNTSASGTAHWIPCVFEVFCLNKSECDRPNLSRRLERS